MYTKPPKTKVIVVGAGFAGIEVVKKLQNRSDVEITLISKTDTFEYYPALYRLVTGALPIEVSVKLHRIFNRKKVNMVTDTYVAIDQTKRVVTLKSGIELPYDYAVLAMGSETNFFNIPGLSEHSFSFKSVKEALRLKRHFCTLIGHSKTMTKEEAVAALHTLVVGGGPSGVELAGDLKEYLMRLCVQYDVDPSLVTVDIIESNNRVLPTMSEKVSRIAEVRLRKMGVNIFINRALTSQELQDIALKDMELKAGTVIWTAGTRISTSFEGLPLTDRKRVVVTSTLNLPEDNRVFVAGDGAGTQYSGLAQTAIHNGTYIGTSIGRMIDQKQVLPYVPHQPSFLVPIGDNWSIFVHNNLVLTGFLPWLLRHIVDFKYFLSTVPFWYVFAVFKQGIKYRKVHGGCDGLHEHE